MTSPTTPAAPRRNPGRLLAALALPIAALGLIAYIVQVSLHRLTTPWYMPVAATVGLILLIVSLWQARTVLRVLALLLLLPLAGAEWMFLIGTRLPAYTGPVTAGQPFPAFATMRADGTPFTQHDLEGDQNNVLVFFRGRW
jgi:hypothetical protein